MIMTFNDKINQIKKAVNIVEIISTYLTLTRKGNNFWAICPFHEDTTPSLSVSQEKQIYKCFSCGQQGNAFIFLQKYKNIDFKSAVKEVAKIMKIDLISLDLNFEDSTQEVHPLTIINDLAKKFYHYQLATASAQEPLAYLTTRNITKENIDYFDIGYAPTKNELLHYLQAQNYQQSEIINAGLAKINAHDKVNDTFSNRIIFTIKDINGACLGFCGRWYKSQTTDFKYINSPETQILKKNQILYNLNNVQNCLKKTDGIYLVEGFMDVIALHNKNIKNCVALMSTNLTKNHIIILKSITNKIIIFLDGDNAGKLASLKIATNLLANDFKVKIIANDTKLDPDELINKHFEKFNSIIKNEIHPFDFAINYFSQQYDFKKDSYQLQEFLKVLTPLWEAIKDPLTKKFYLNLLIDITKLSEKELNLILKPVPIVNKSSKSKIIKPLITQNKLEEAQKQLIFLVLLSRNVYLILENQKFIFPNKNYLNLYFLISQKYQNSQLLKIEFSDILNDLKDNYLFESVQTIINQYQTKKFDLHCNIINDYLKIINNQLIENEIKVLNVQLKDETNINNKIKILKTISTLKNKRKN